MLRLFSKWFSLSAVQGDPSGALDIVLCSPGESVLQATSQLTDDFRRYGIEFRAWSRDGQGPPLQVCFRLRFWILD